MNQPLLKGTQVDWRKNLLRASFAFVTLICVAETARAQAIFGSVRTVGGVPIEGVLVRATETRFPFGRFSTSTDSQGGYVVGAGLSGTYQVEAIEAGYAFTPASTNVTISGSSIRVDFTTPATFPTATTLEASNVLASSAMLRASVRPNGAATMVWFEYGPTTAYGGVSASGSVGSGTAFVTVNRNVSGLLNNTNYHFRVVASNSFGVRFGADLGFNTLSGIPLVVTLAPTEGGATSMRLNGSAIPNGANANARFEWGGTTNYGNVTATQFPGGGTTATNFSQMLTGLVAGASYHYRAVVATSFATSYGSDVLFTPGFSDISAGFPGPASTARSSGSWGDYNNDGRLDILFSGTGRVWRNTGSGFVSINAGLPALQDGSAAWGDYDNDDRLDILLAGDILGSGGLTAQVWRNTGNGFININAGLPGVEDSSVAWGDYDNDGRLDILLTGFTDSNRISQVWRNTSSGFANINAGLPGVNQGSAAWGDYDNDGRLDILLTGFTGSDRISQVWRNTGSGFTNLTSAVAPGLFGVSAGSIAWGDYDNDGRLDILLTGFSSAPIAQVWRNTGSGFVNINAGLTPVGLGSGAWGDYDNDGRLDILLTGTTNFQYGGAISQVWRNTGSGFADIGAGLPGIFRSSASWGDYDNDGRLDILANGFNADNDPISQVWRNNLPATNTAPTAPSGLNLTVSNTIATLTWNPAADNETPAAGLTYNLRIGTTPGGSDVLSPMSSANGLRRLPQLGSAQHGLSAMIEDYTVGTPYYWSVQAVDNAFAGSPFSSESSFKLLPVVVPLTATNTIPGDLDGDGMVDTNELSSVLVNYWQNNPWLQMTNPMKLSDGFFQFALTNDAVWNFSVEVTTNFMDWNFLGPAFPVYQFLDAESTNQPQRYYRLRYP